MGTCNSVPQAIKNLKLLQAFKGLTPKVMDCAEVSCDPLQRIVDDEKGTHRTDEVFNDEKGCICLNPDEYEIVLLPLDRALIKQRFGGMCDGALFDEKKFFFLEFKDNSLGNTEATIESTYTKAIKQLTQGLNLFRDKLSSIEIDFEKHVDVTCVLILSNIFPRHRAKEQDLMVSFANQNMVALSFERTIHFD